eukprot:GHVR01107472.1.p1 GENE.GHVR01107472.1~~GHVR01107472.1.p1  ORF type:complete len:167 (+),score=25.07 GHVR01107472.1:474-974(+)
MKSLCVCVCVYVYRWVSNIPEWRRRGLKGSTGVEFTSDPTRKHHEGASNPLHTPTRMSMNLHGVQSISRSQLNSLEELSRAKLNSFDDPDTGSKYPNILENIPPHLVSSANVVIASVNDCRSHRVHPNEWTRKLLQYGMAMAKHTALVPEDTWGLEVRRRAEVYAA